MRASAHVGSSLRVQRMKITWTKWKAKERPDVSGACVPLHDTYDDKEEVKALGAIFNLTTRKFQVPPDTALRPVSRWLPEA